MATQAIAEMSKTSLVKKVQGMAATKVRQTNAAERFGDKIFNALGSGTAFATGAALGFAEVRWQNPDGSPLSLGPVRASLAASFALTGVAFFFDPGRQVSYAAAGAAGAYGLGWGQRMAVAAKAKKKKIGGVGYDDDDWDVSGDDDYGLTDAEAEAIGT